MLTNRNLAIRARAIYFCFCCRVLAGFSVVSYRVPSSNRPDHMRAGIAPGVVVVAQQLWQSCSCGWCFAGRDPFQIMARLAVAFVNKQPVRKKRIKTVRKKKMPHSHSWVARRKRCSRTEQGERVPVSSAVAGLVCGSVAPPCLSPGPDASDAAWRCGRADSKLSRAASSLSVQRLSPATWVMTGIFVGLR